MQDSAEAMGCSHTGVRRPPLLFWGYLSEAKGEDTCDGIPTLWSFGEVTVCRVACR